MSHKSHHTDEGSEERLLSSRGSSHDDEILEELAAQQALDRNARRRPWRKICEGVFYISAGVLAGFLVDLMMSHWHFPTDNSVSVPEWTVIDGGQRFRAWAPSAQCGDTPEKAIAAGCIYDDVLLHWMPQACSSPELIDEFEHVWPWEFFEDQHATSQISIPDVRKGTQDIKWVSMDLHRWHCVATWKILSSAARWGTTVPGYSVNWNHSVHCADHVLINMHTDDPFTINSHLDIEYTPCVTIAEDRTIARAKTW
ncbi:hypothetical protein GQ607_013535 [Colletotrichum asianum]|uniref:Uncharacterized protein n=1 Tax=Colletotrichum asianum TaxID=702518 RepID=A0A8H3ZMK5_9PEZI|nr:hypothetical protein GQ607_013535 [Colletotrichum asianum]